MENYGIIGSSEGMRHVISEIKIIGRFTKPVIITGESGTGKELVARGIHQKGKEQKRTGKFVRVNCAALPEGLIESLLFGYKEGSFTGAGNGSKGAFRNAEKGTLFLDEIGDMPIHVQVKLFIVIECGEISTVGSDKIHEVDVRVIAATNQDLEKMISEKKFRKELHYRLNILNIDIPPLRERMEDIPLLVEHFLKKYCEEESNLNSQQIYETCIKIFADDHELCKEPSEKNLALKGKDFIDSVSVEAALYQAQGTRHIIELFFRFYYGIEKMTPESIEKMFVERFSQKALKYGWPGNIRELSKHVFRSLAYEKIDIPEIKLPIPQKTAREKKREKKEENQTKAEKRKGIKKLIEKVVIGEYNGRISLAIKDPRLCEAGINTVSKLIGKLDCVSLKEACRSARKEFFGKISEEEISERMIEYGGNIRKLCEYYCISFKEISERFGVVLKKMKKEIKEGKK